MKFDPEGIARNSRWNNESNIFEDIIEYYEHRQLDISKLRQEVNELWHRFKGIPWDKYDFNHSFLERLKGDQNMLEAKLNKFVGDV